MVGRVDVTASDKIDGGEAGHVAQLGAGAGGWIDGQQMGQDLRPSRPARWVFSVTGIRCDQQCLGVGAVGGGVISGKLVAEDGLGEPVQL